MKLCYDTTGATLHFAVRSSTANPTVEIDAYGPDDEMLGYVMLSTYLPSMSANTWYEVDNPLTELSATSTQLTGFSAMRSTTGTLYFDEIEVLTPGTTGTTTTAFTYDSLGNRIGKSIDGTPAYRYVNGPGEYVLRSTDVQSGTDTYYVYGLGLISQGGATSSVRTYPLVDGMGNVRYLTNSAGAIVGEYTYDPFGNITIASGTATSFAFQTEQQDVESGLTYLRARYYDPTTGSFTAKDPFPGYADAPQGQNGYDYANGDPVNLSDPSGLWVETAWDIANVAYDIKTCSWGSLAFDLAATVIPGLPAGLTKVVKVEQAAESALQAGKVAEEARDAYTVYHGLDAAGTTRYAGLTKRDPAVRFAEHLTAQGTGRELLDYRVINGATNLSKADARIMEQTLINQYGLGKDGGLLLNRINSIAPSKWSTYNVTP